MDKFGHKKFHRGARRSHYVVASRAPSDILTGHKDILAGHKDILAGHKNAPPSSTRDEFSESSTDNGASDVHPVASSSSGNDSDVIF